MESKEHSLQDVPPRRRCHGTKTDLPGSRPAPNALWRVLAVALVLAAAMGGGLLWAKTYAARDWSEQVSAARKQPRPAPAASRGSPGRASRPRLSGRALALPACAGRPADAAAWLAVARGGTMDAAARTRGFLLAQARGAPGETVLNELGVMDLAKGRFALALSRFAAALEVRPGFLPALYNRALCEARLGQTALALADAAAYAGRHPRDAGATRLLAALLCELDRAPEALELLERSLARNGNPALALDAAELAAREGALSVALLHLEAAVEAGVPLAGVARTWKGPLFDTLRTSPDGRAFTAALAARVRQAANLPSRNAPGEAP